MRTDGVADVVVVVIQIVSEKTMVFEMWRKLDIRNDDLWVSLCTFALLIRFTSRELQHISSLNYFIAKKILKVSPPGHTQKKTKSCTAICGQ
jgi:hypothetical protein